jgi:hypothetical protein
MKNNSIYLKVARDMFIIQLTWALGFLGIMLLIHIVKLVLASIQGNGIDYYFDSVFIATNIFMLVVGIISVYFLPHYVENGVTRKDYFKGAVLGAVGLSISIPIITFLVSRLSNFIVSKIDSVSFRAQIINDVESDGNLIGDIVQSIILSPYVDPDNNWILAIAIFSLNIFIYYLAGWFISSGFYRYHTVIGLVFILFTLIAVTLKDTLLRNLLELPVLDRFSAIDFPDMIAIPGLIIISAIFLWLIRLITRRVTIKM